MRHRLLPGAPPAARRLLVCALVWAVLAGGISLFPEASLSPQAHAQEAAAEQGERRLSDAARRRIERERVRQAVEGAYTLALTGRGDLDDRGDNVTDAGTALVELGEPVIPFLLAELDAENRNTFTFVAYAMGRLGDVAETSALEDVVESLETAIRRTDDDISGFASARKAWSILALAGLGKREGLITTLDTGTHIAGREGMFFMTSMSEIVARLTAPECYPEIHALIEHYTAEKAAKDAAAAAGEDAPVMDATDPSMPTSVERDLVADERPRIVEGLRLAPDPVNLPHLKRYLLDPGIAFRREVVRAVSALEHDEVVPLLLSTLLDDPDPTVRYTAGNHLVLKEVALDPEPLFDALTREPDSNVRTRLYHLIARSGKRQARRLAREFGLADPVDRAGLIEALGTIDSVSVVPLIEPALSDRAPRVMIAAIDALAELGSSRSLELLKQVAAGDDWIRARLAIEALIERRDPTIGDLLEQRLFEDELAPIVIDPQHRERVYFMIDWLLDLERSSVGPKLAKARERQLDGNLLLRMEAAESVFEAISEANSKRGGWNDLAMSDDERAASIAKRHLARDGSKEALATLQASLDAEELPSNGRPFEDWLKALEPKDDAATLGLLETLLMNERFDRARYYGARAHAAYLASRIPEGAGTELLRRAVDRRRGLDAFPLLYLAAADPVGGRERIERDLTDRLWFVHRSRGIETDLLIWTMNQIDGGRTLGRLQRPPTDFNMKMEI